jgi:peptidoglycan/LPS O-acetylase OafA/YrhL
MDRIKGFDGLRGLAVLAVVLQHTTRLGDTLNIGSYGVYLFFALSGFLIVRILHRERSRIEAGGTGVGRAMRRFFWRRSLRVMPIYYLVLTVFAVLSAFVPLADFAFPDAWWHFAYLSNVYFGEVEGRWIGRFDHLWSLAVEEQFYLLAAPALLLAPAAWSRTICVLVAVAAVAQLALMQVTEANDVAVYTNTLVNFGALAIGGLVGLSAPARPAAGGRSGPGLICLALIAAVAVAFPLVGPMPRHLAGLVSGAPFVASSLLAALALLAVFLNQEGALTRWLEWRPLAALGTISYGLYLYHKLLPHWMLTGLARRLGLAWQAPELLEAAVIFLIALAMAALSWVMIERPLLRLKDRPPRLAAAPSPSPLIPGDAATQAFSKVQTRLKPGSPLPRG